MTESDLWFIIVGVKTVRSGQLASRGRLFIDFLKGGGQVVSSNSVACRILQAEGLTDSPSDHCTVAQLCLGAVFLTQSVMKLGDCPEAT